MTKKTPRGPRHKPQPDGRIACPFCSGSFTVALVNYKPAVLHSVPMCRKFKLDPIEFLIAARRKIVGPMPWDKP